MVKFYKSDNQGKIIEVETLSKGCWVDVVNPSDVEVDMLVSKTGINEEMLKAPLDESESARFEVDEGNYLYIVDVPIIEEDNDNDNYSTLPIGICYNQHYLITVCLEENAIIRDFAKGRVKGIYTENHLLFLLKLMYRNSVKFISCLKQIDRKNHRLQAELHRSMKNKELFQLLDLEKSLVYISTSLTANDRLYDRLSKLSKVKESEEYLDLLEDAVIENKQAIETCNIYVEILSGTMDAVSSIISNNVSSVMKVLTLVTIFLSIPSLIAALWGMNVPVPFGHNKFGFWIVLAISVVLAVFGSFALVKFSGGGGRVKKKKKDKKD